MTTEWEILLRAALAAVFGGVIGYDRLVRSKPAGIRTHMLVAMGSALAVGVSALVVEETIGAGRADAVRVAAGVITGVGFLGAGAIMRGPEGGVRGLTTAAGIWVTAAIGIALGFGYYIVGTGATVMAVIIISLLAGVDQPETKPDAPSAAV